MPARHWERPQDGKTLLLCQTGTMLSLVLVAILSQPRVAVSSCSFAHLMGVAAPSVKELSASKHQVFEIMKGEEETTEAAIVFNAIHSIERELDHMNSIARLATASNERALRALARQLLAGPAQILRASIDLAPSVLRGLASRTRIPALAIEVRALIEALDRLNTALEPCLPK